MIFLLVREGVYGGDVDRIADMDVLTVIAMADVCMRMQYREKIENAWTTMISSQGTNKGLQKWLKPWSRIAYPGEAEQNDEEAFIKRFKQGGI